MHSASDTLQGSPLAGEESVAACTSVGDGAGQLAAVLSNDDGELHSGRWLTGRNLGFCLVLRGGVTSFAQTAFGCGGRIDLHRPPPEDRQ